MSPVGTLLLTARVRAIENGANALAEGFLFTVASVLIVAETWRSSRSQSKRRDKIDDHLEELESRVTTLVEETETLKRVFEERWEEEKQRCVSVPSFRAALADTGPQERRT